VIGHTEMLPNNAQQQLAEALAETAQNTGLNLIMALSYSSRREIEDAIKKIAKAVQNSTLAVEDINGETLNNYLDTNSIPDPELLIRTSGEYRLSNFLLYQLAYTELYFTDTLWPDFRKEDLYKAILDFQKRERRFGKTGEQIKQVEE
jgi:undecaprenyl diphosphate synthase